MSSSPSSLCHQDICNFPFPYKLWIAVNSVTCEFIKWNIDGTQIQVHLMALDNYLNRPRSIFKIKSRSSFVNHLRDYAFELTKTEVIDGQEVASECEFEAAYSGPKYSEIVMQFSHTHFLRHRIDLLANIRKLNDTNSVGVAEGKPASINCGSGTEDDLCFKRIGFSTQLSRAHLKHQLILNFMSETKALESKLKASEIKSKIKENQGNDEDSMIELSAELFENPHDSVMYMGEEHPTAYAGFYGNCTNEQVFKFFGPYLPMYENENSDEGDTQIANLNSTGKTPPQPSNFEINISINEESSVPTEEVTKDNTPPVHLPPQNVPFPSSLEPIFLPDDEKDEDILMDEFIKFKEQAGNQDSNKSLEEAKVKMEEDCSITQENQENDDNFKNFFSQYRESLNLLYEKQ